MVPVHYTCSIHMPDTLSNHPDPTGELTVLVGTCMFKGTGNVVGVWPGYMHPCKTCNMLTRLSCPSRPLARLSCGCMLHRPVSGPQRAYGSRQGSRQRPRSALKLPELMKSDEKIDFHHPLSEPAPRDAAVAAAWRKGRGRWGVRRRRATPNRPWQTCAWLCWRLCLATTLTS